MIAPATSFLTYLWHYMLARLLYDELVRGRWLAPLLLVAVALLGLLVRVRRRT